MKKTISKIEEIINSNDELNLNDIEYLLYNTENRNDFLVLNHIEKRIIENYGENFLLQSEDKIGKLIELMLEDNVQDIYNYYKGAFDQYMELCQYKFEAITSFNIIYITHCHIALKVIRLENS